MDDDGDLFDNLRRVILNYRRNCNRLIKSFDEHYIYLCLHSYIHNIQLEKIEGLGTAFRTCKLFSLNILTRRECCRSFLLRFTNYWIVVVDVPSEAGKLWLCGAGGGA